MSGEGWSCPVIVGGRVYLTEAVQIKAAESSGSGRGNGGRTELTTAVYRYDVICLDATSGEKIWRAAAHQGNPPLPRHSTNTYATETPVSDGERVYAYFGMTGVYCFDLEGQPVWEKDLGNFQMRAGWGTASSPVLYEDKLILQIDNEEQSFLVAIDKLTGDELWRTERNEPSQYSSPIIWRNSLRSEVIVGGQFYRSYDPASGELLWQLDMEKGRSSATPVAIGDRLYVGTELRNRGGNDDGGGFLFAVKPGGTGDISPAQGERSGEFVAWKIAGSNIQMASPVLCEGHLYLLERRAGIVNCVNAETGEISYRTRVSGASAFWSSPWTSDGKVYCLDDSGTTFVIAGGSQFRELGSNELGEQAWASPAVADGKLYLRTVDHLYCIGSSDQQ